MTTKTKSIAMTTRLCTGIGILQNFHPSGERLVQRQLRRCCKLAEKYGWDEAYLTLAAEFCVANAIHAIRRASLDGEVIRSPRKFLGYHIGTALKRDRLGRVIIPLWKQELRMGNGTIVTYSDTQEGL